MDSAAPDDPVSHSDASADRSVERIAGMADVCVKCGLCLPHCPTYRISGLEGESPRGRIALIQGLTTGRLPAGGQTAMHLESCTGCLGCETVCPAGVSYGELIDLGRAELKRRGHGGHLLVRGLKFLARRPRASRALLGLLRIARRLGARRAAPLLGVPADTVIGRIVARLPARTLHRRDRPPQAPSKSREEVMLFTGCVSSALDRQTLEDAADVLSRCAYRVEIPGAQGCCGALDLHDGSPGKAAALASANLVAFGDEGAPILTVASGCTATLDEYERLVGPGAEAFRRRLHDLGSFLNEHWTDSSPNLSPVNARAVLFEPCTARNNRRRKDGNADLLRRIPGLDLRLLSPGYGCCGAAGHHFITRPGQADKLAEPILNEISSLDPDYVVVSNVGCALHLAGSLESSGGRANVVHPVSLLRRSLAGSG